MKLADDASWSERWYRLLWLVYPKAFRAEYGQDALELFRDRRREVTRESGTFGLVQLWARTVPDVLVHGTLERAGQIHTALRQLVRGSSLPYAVRRLRRAPGFTGTVVVTLGVGIAATVALFSVLEGVLLEPLPFANPDRLVRLWEHNPDLGAERHGVSPLNFADWEREASRFEAMAAWYLTSGTYRTEQAAEEVRAAQVTVDFFRVLGVAPALGRDFRRAEVVRYGPVILSHGLWMRLFGGDPSVVGTRIQISGDFYEVIGVMPPEFAFPDESVESWMAWDLPAVYADRPEARTWRFMDGIARLPPDMSHEDADEEMARVAATLAERHPRADGGWSASVTSLQEEMVGGVRTALWVAFGAAMSILLLACANVAHMLLARAPSRRRELALRRSLGAPQSSLGWQLLMESLAMSGLAALLGLVLGAGALKLFVAVEAGRIPRLSGVRIDAEVFAFAIVLTVVATVVFGVAPAIQTLRGAGPAALGDGERTTDSRGQRRLREWFVGGQVAVALILLMGAALLTSTLRRLTAIDPGFDPDHVMTFRVSLDGGGRDDEEVVRYYDRLTQRIADLPGVEGVGAVQTLPMNPVGNDFRRPYRPTGSQIVSAEAPTAQMRIVTPGYIDAAGMRLVEGRPFRPGMTADGPLVAMVNRTFARRLWPDVGAVDQSFELDFRGGWGTYRVVGVVEDIRHYGLRREPEPEIFLAHRQSPYLAMSFAVRVEGRPEPRVPDLRAAVLSHRPLQPPHAFVALDDLVEGSVAEERFLSVLLTLLAAIGVLFAATGVYSVVAYSVSHRRQEIGVRMALGAPPARVATEVVQSALKIAMIGVFVGALGVIGLGGLVEHLVYGGPARDPMTAIAVALALLFVSALAAFMPAFRASRVTPSESIRAQ